MNKIIAGKTILLNIKTNSTFIASRLDEKVQTGTRGNDSHIEWSGELSVAVPIQEDFEEAVKILKDIYDGDGTYFAPSCIELPHDQSGFEYKERIEKLILNIQDYGRLR